MRKYSASTKTETRKPDHTHSAEQFLHGLIEAIVHNPNFKVAVQQTDDSILASVMVDAGDQPKVIGSKAQNILAMQALFRCWCLINCQLSSQLNCLEPSGRRKQGGKTQVKIVSQTQWLMGELFPEAEFEVSMEGSDLAIRINQEIDISLLGALGRYLRAAAKNAGQTVQVYIRRPPEGSGD